MTAPADSRISDERLTEILDIEGPDKATLTVGEALAALTELRERRAQAVTVPDGWVKKAREAFVAAVREQDAGWTDEADEGEELLVSPGGDYFALDLPIIAAFAAAPPPAQAAAVTEWQPIETAPKDGTEVLGICASAYSPTASVTWWEEKWLTFSKPEKFITSNPHGWFPTHWFPLPSLSAQDREE